ncbi:hypothetical protein K402DRAFT_38325 [Aulographum hederae CBS 113979]|uniref:Uncharacterized protein n=1 Tax=Aulographum hederae CBS 113979 TaxID=1176131 RepID=A0A6G1H4P8_9PEZI|nr:hypothetical protein K402DRAFT_38325 [Aulographum hederae CBS 113979]
MQFLDEPSITILTASPRRMTIFLSLIILISNLALLLLLFALPGDAAHILQSYKFYTIFAVVASCLGLCGSALKIPHLASIFANYLTFDAVITVFPRLILVLSIPTFGATICDTVWHLAVPASHSTYSSVNGMDGITQSDEFWQQLERAEAWDVKRCEGLLWGFQAVLALSLTGMTVVQWWFSTRVREYAAMLLRRERGLFVGDEEMSKL